MLKSKICIGWFKSPQIINARICFKHDYRLERDPQDRPSMAEEVKVEDKWLEEQRAIGKE